MAEPLRKLPLEEEETVELEIVPAPTLPGTPPAVDEARAREMGVINSEPTDVATSMGERAGNTMANIGESVKHGMDVVTERSKEMGEKLSDVAEQTGARAREMAIEAGRRAQDLREAAIYRAWQARREARRLANERPIEAVLAIAGAAFVIGLVLRIWRSNRD